MTGTRTPPAGSRYRDALARRDFRLLVLSFGVDVVGTWAGSVVLHVYVYDRTGSASALAVTSACRYVPLILVSGYAGVVADRYDRARLMLASSLSSAGVAAAMAVVVATDGPVWVLLALSSLLAVTVAPYAPAAGALTADTVGERDLAAANALYGVVDNLGVVLGPVIGAVVLAAGSPVLGFGLNAASFAVAAALVAAVAVRSRGDAGGAGEGLRQQVTDGLRALAADRVARTLTFFMLLGTAVYGTTTVLYVAYSEEVGGGSEGYAYLLAGQAVGGVVAAAVVNRLAARGRLWPVILTGLLIQALPLAGLAGTGSLAGGIALQVVLGVGLIVIDVLALTALQRSLPRVRLSRVLGIVTALAYGAALLGSVLAGALVDALGVGGTCLALGLGAAGVALAATPALIRAETGAAAVADLDARVAVLEELDLLADASRPALERLALGLTVVGVAADEVLIRQGEPADAFYVVVAGHFSVTVDGVPTNTVAAGQYAGEIGLLHHRPRTASVTATEPSTVWRLEGEDFVDTLSGGASASLRGVAASRLARRPRTSAWALPDAAGERA